VNILLDTCSFLWLLAESRRLSKYASEIFENAEREIFLSVVTCWEISVKFAAGRLELPEPPGKLLPKVRERLGLQGLPLDEESALYVARLPRLHSDPFDRMLICQSIVHGMAILTPDEAIAQYPVRTLW
jgi:PIN domain nuclease of toxin-antitoxin system